MNVPKEEKLKAALPGAAKLVVTATTNTHTDSLPMAGTECAVKQTNATLNSSDKNQEGGGGAAAARRRIKKLSADKGTLNTRLSVLPGIVGDARAEHIAKFTGIDHASYMEGVEELTLRKYSFKKESDTGMDNALYVEGVKQLTMRKYCFRGKDEQATKYFFLRRLDGDFLQRNQHIMMGSIMDCWVSIMKQWATFQTPENG